MSSAVTDYFQGLGMGSEGVGRVGMEWMLFTIPKLPAVMAFNERSSFSD